MSRVSILNNLVSNAANQAAQALPLALSAQNTSNAAANSNNPFGSAVTVNLSAAAQAIVAAQPGATGQAGAQQGYAAASPNSSSPPSGNNSSPSKGSGGAPVRHIRAGGGGGGVSASEVSTEVELAKSEVAAQVGVVAANSLVDSKGNIDEVGLAREIAQQAQEAEFLSGAA